MTARMNLLATVILIAVYPTIARAAEDAPPKLLDPRLKIELFAEHPQIVTPTGIDVDHLGRVWAIESNTHHRASDYQGHDSDRVLIMRDTNNDGRADDIVVFTDGLVHTMSIAVRPDGAVYIATRKEVLLFRDTDGDGKADSRERILHLDTPGDYPHNGLAGFAFDALGWMYIGMGENLGADYKLIGTDGSVETGGGEGGNVFRCRPDGSKLTRFATGFWNPYASCFDTFGRMFTVDNDPDSRPPCRLLHTIRGGDYGYRYRNGRRGVHPFTSWNGELPGTLPMVAGTGEAPSGIVAYESDGFPEEYIGSLLVGSWGDHRIDRFQLKPRGTSFTSKAEPLIIGGENFRPVGLAVAPDGSLYFTDWVLKDYPVHGHGRIWRVSAVEEPQREVIDTATITGRPVAELTELLKSKRLDVRRAAATSLAGTEEGRTSLVVFSMNSSVSRRLKIESVSALGLAISASDFWIIFQKMKKSKPDGRAGMADGLVVLHEKLPHFGDWERYTGLSESRLRRYLEMLIKNQDYFDDYSYDSSRVLSVLNLFDLLRYKQMPEGFLRFTHKVDTTYFSFNRGFSNPDPFIFGKLIDVVCNVSSTEALQKLAQVETTLQPRPRLGYFLALRHKAPKFKTAAEAGLSDPSPDIQRAAVQWIAEENFQGLRPQLQQLLTDGNLSTDLFEATLAALAILDGVERDGDFKTKIKNEIDGSQYVLQLVTDPQQQPQLRARALRALDPAHAGLNEKLFNDLLAVADPVLTLETVRTLQASPIPTAAQLLADIARDENRETNVRAEALVGLAAQPIDAASRELLTSLLSSEDRALQIEALRAVRKIPPQDFNAELNTALTNLSTSLISSKGDDVTDDDHELAEQLNRALTVGGQNVPRNAALRTKRPQTIEEWQKLLEQPGDADAGRRVFFHSGGAGCYRCHTVNGRGGQIGPELSKVAGTLKRDKLVQSILEPSAEIAPQFSGWSFVMQDGKVHSGLILAQDREGLVTIGDTQGNVLELSSNKIDERVPQKTSIMPEKLQDQLTVREFRDLLAYLETLK
ncbi:Cytochrome c [Symmachiella dynata]|uniref:PVC-type heme-binding CxxCH protein n=1 Tax=Symmachiella dynata TaxID=2527995 RepID=UPI00118B8310|nr:PVC-type heme-binding CxxCH protein [Symmachiella dynata]QDT51446.1 Cytochrome c [Symmachiella dynata]